MIVREMSYHLDDGIFREKGKDRVAKGKRRERKKERVRDGKEKSSSIHGLRAEFHPSKVEIRVRVPVDALF